MKKLVIWPFGTSDLKLDGKLIKDHEDFQSDEFKIGNGGFNLYEATKKINDEFENYKNRISFHMLESFLKKVKDKKVIVK